MEAWWVDGVLWAYVARSLVLFCAVHNDAMETLSQPDVSQKCSATQKQTGHVNVSPYISQLTLFEDEDEIRSCELYSVRRVHRKVTVYCRMHNRPVVIRYQLIFYSLTNFYLNPALNQHFEANTWVY